MQGSIFKLLNQWCSAVIRVRCMCDLAKRLHFVILSFAALMLPLVNSGSWSFYLSRIISKKVRSFCVFQEISWGFFSA